MNRKKSTAQESAGAVVSQTIDDNGKLSPEQIQNWRRVLMTMIGPYALTMPDEEVQRQRDVMQKRTNKLSG